MPFKDEFGEFIFNFFVAGYIAVPVFFMISGFVVFYNYGDQALLGTKVFLGFLLRRLSRLAPMFYLSLLIGVGPYLGNTLTHVPITVDVLMGTVRDLAFNASFLGVTSHRSLRLNYSGQHDPGQKSPHMSDRIF